MTTDKATEDQYLGDVEEPVIVDDGKLDGGNGQDLVKSTSKDPDIKDVDVTENEDGHEVEEVGSNGSSTGGDGGLPFNIKDEQIPLAAHVFASMIFLIAVATAGSNIKWYGYGLSVGILGMVFGVCASLVAQYKADYQKYTAGLLVVWAAIGFFIFTFADQSPFKWTGNGKCTDG